MIVDRVVPENMKSKHPVRVFTISNELSKRVLQSRDQCLGVNEILAELAERSSIIIQNSSNPSSRKNLDVRPYDRTRCYF